MVRYARASGSKSSNERIPFEATPWSEMLKQMRDENQMVRNVEDEEDRVELLPVYDNDAFLNERKTENYLQSTDIYSDAQQVCENLSAEGTVKEKKKKVMGSLYVNEAGDSLEEKFILEEKNQRKTVALDGKKKKYKNSLQNEMTWEEPRSKKQHLDVLTEDSHTGEPVLGTMLQRKKKQKKKMEERQLEESVVDTMLQKKKKKKKEESQLEESVVGTILPKKKKMKKKEENRESVLGIMVPKKKKMKKKKGEENTVEESMVGTLLPKKKMKKKKEENRDSVVCIMVPKKKKIKKKKGEENTVEESVVGTMLSEKKEVKKKQEEENKLVVGTLKKRKKKKKEESTHIQESMMGTVLQEKDFEKVGTSKGKNTNVKKNEKHIGMQRIEPDKHIQKDKFENESLRCFHCGSSDHTSWDCSSTALCNWKSGSSEHAFRDSESMFSDGSSCKYSSCSKCGGDGHLAQHCHELKFTHASYTEEEEEEDAKSSRFGINSAKSFFSDSVDTLSFDGFTVKKEDALYLQELKQKLKAKGIPWEEIKEVLKKERRNAEKRLRREKSVLCFHCRRPGHVLSECPELGQEEETYTGICFKCGSTEHFSQNCKMISHGNDEFRFAKCFICGEQGHLSRQCPDNRRGLYPLGGSCRICGDVTHFQKDCPKHQEQKKETVFTVGRIGMGKKTQSVDAVEYKMRKPVETVQKKVKKVVKF